MWLLTARHTANRQKMDQSHFPIWLSKVLDPQKNGSKSLIAAIITYVAF